MACGLSKFCGLNNTKFTEILGVVEQPFAEQPSVGIMESIAVEDIPEAVGCTFEAVEHILAGDRVLVVGNRADRQHFLNFAFRFVAHH